MRSRLLVPAFLVVTAAGCGGGGEGLFAGGGACTAGESASCDCAGGAVGTKVCLADGTAYGACQCPDSGGTGGSAGYGGDASVDVAPDVSPTDGAGGKDSQGKDGAGGSPGDGGDGSAIANLGDPCSKAGQLACAGHAQKLMLLCDGTKWVSNGVCSGNQLCDTRPGTTAGSCQDPVPLCLGKQPGDGVCDGANRVVCGPDLLTSTTVVCASAALCQAGKGDQCAVCIDGEHQCDAANLMKCAPDHLAWEFDTACASGALCDPVAAKCNPAACSPNQYHCTGDTLEKCNAGLTGFDPVQTCQPGLCDFAGKQCDICKPGTTTCASSTSFGTCAPDGQSINAQPCPAQTPLCVGAGQCTSCTHQSIVATAQPLDMFFMLDTSGSMAGTNMTAVQQGVNAYCNDPASAGVWVGGNRFPIDVGGGTGSCVPSDYATSVVPWSALPSPAFTSWVSGLVANNLTPTIPALQGAINACKTRLLSQPAHKCVVVFATDGEPTECDPNNNAKVELGAMSAAAYSAGIPIYAIGFPNLSAIGADILAYVAQQGGTGSPTTVQTGAQMNAALKSIQASVISCTFTKPAGTIAQVDYAPTSGPTLPLPQVLDSTQCAGDAWYFDNNATPTQILVCPATCNRFKTDPASKLDVKTCQ